MLERLGVQDQTSYMAAAHRDSLALDSIFISPQLVTQLSAVVEEAVAAGQWTDALASLPTAVQSRDASAILLKAFSDQTQGKDPCHPIVIRFSTAHANHALSAHCLQG